MRRARILFALISPKPLPKQTVHILRPQPVLKRLWQVADIVGSVGGAHGKGPVAAEQHPVFAQHSEDQRQSFRGVHDGVDVKAAHRDERVCKVGAKARAHRVLAALQAAGERGDGTAAMRQQYTQPRMAFQHAAHHQLRGDNGRLDRVAHKITQVVGVESGVIEAEGWMTGIRFVSRPAMKVCRIPTPAPARTASVCPVADDTARVEHHPLRNSAV